MDEQELDVLLNEYERAQELAHHSDAVFWEITSIIWGANTLMLGFVLEAMGNCRAKLLIGQRIAFKACRGLEARLRTHSQLHTRIHAEYPKHFVQWLVYLVTFFFLATWGVVGLVDYGYFGIFLVIAAAFFVGFLLFLFWRRGRKTLDD